MSQALHRFDNSKRTRDDNHDRQRMLTPTYVLEGVREVFRGSIGLDPCTEPDNPTGADRFYCLPDDGCVLPWDAETIFCNPPYGEARNRWAKRCIEESEHRQVILLIPSHTDTRVSQLCLAHCTTVLLVNGRLKFGAVRKNGMEEAASHGSALFGFGVDLSPLRRLGVVLCPI